jgi:hypothetical protein
MKKRAKEKMTKVKMSVKGTRKVKMKEEETGKNNQKGCPASSVVSFPVTRIMSDNFTHCIE